MMDRSIEQTIDRWMDRKKICIELQMHRITEQLIDRMTGETKDRQNDRTMDSTTNRMTNRTIEQLIDITGNI